MFNNLVVIFIVFVFVGVLCGSCVQISGYWYVRDVSTEIVGVDRIIDSDDSFYLVFAKDKNTGENLELENTDDMFRRKFRSSTLQNTLQQNIGETMCLKISNRRIGWLSWYPNIIAATPGECDE